MTTMAADEAQALLTAPYVRVETGRIRDGVVEDAEVIEIPEAFFKTIENSVVEQLTFARNKALATYPRVAAKDFVDDWVSSGLIARSDARRIQKMMELEFKRAIEAFSVDARDRVSQRLPITLRSLIPLITRRSGKS